MPTKYVTLDEDLAIHYVHAGPTTLPGEPPTFDQGSPLLFLHGEGGSASLWSRQMDHFSSDHNPVAIDFPAHGRSTGLDSPESVEQAVELVDRVVQALAAPPMVVVGMGLGGQLALLLAVRAPERVRAVVTLGASAAPRGATREIASLREVVAGRSGQRFDTPFFGSAPDMAVVREFWTEMVKTDPRVRLQDLLLYESSDIRERLAEVQVPVLVIHGEEDRVCSPERAEELVNGIPQARLALVPKAGHVAHLERPDGLNATIEEFLP